MTYDPNQQPPPQPYNPQPVQPQYIPQQYPPQPPYGVVQPPPQKPKKHTALIIVGAVFGAFLLLCVIGVVASSGGSDDKGAKTSVAAPTTGAAKKDGTGKPATKQADEPADDAKAFDAAIGSTITVDDGDGNVQQGTLRSVKTFKKGCGSFAPAPENGMYVVLDVLVVQKQGKGTVNPLDFTFVTDDGTSNNEISGAFSGCEKPALGAADLRTGQKRAGKMAFDVTGKSGSLEWAPGGLLADTVGSWKTS